MKYDEINVTYVPLWRYFFFQAEDGIRDTSVTGVQTCALPISGRPPLAPTGWSWFIGGVSPPPDLIFSEYGLKGLDRKSVV